MRIRTQDRENGGTLVMTLIVCVVIGIMLAAYLSMVTNQHRLSQRSQVWNNCIPMCEAAVEEALAHLNHINTTNNFAVNGWTSNNAAFHKTRTLNDGITRVAISNDNPPTITVVATLKAPIAGHITRSVRVKTRINQKFPNGIVSKGGVTLGGSGRIDSFNSALPGVESDINGQYTPFYATDRATVVTTANTLGIINVGNMSIYGSAAVGPGGTASLGPNGNIGSKPWNDNPSWDGMIEPGHITDDVNLYVPDAALPTQFIPKPWPLPVPTLIGGVVYLYIFDDGDYRSPGNFTLSLSDKVYIRGHARIHITGQTTVNNTAGITIASTNASVEWYASLAVSIGGSGVVNVSGLAKNFSLIGLRTCPSVIYNGSSRFVGTCYAPQSAVSISGTADAIGAIVGRTFTLGGTMGLHYDESLKGDPRKNRFIAASWQEL